MSYINFLHARSVYTIYMSEKVARTFLLMLMLFNHSFIIWSFNVARSGTRRAGWNNPLDNP